MNAKTGGMVMLVIGAILLVFSLTTPSFGEIVAIDENKFADRSTLHGYLYSLDDKIVFVMYFAGSLDGGYKTAYVCSDKWDLQKVNNATNKISEYINKNKNINIKEMLKKAGLQNCKYK